MAVLRVAVLGTVGARAQGQQHLVDLVQGNFFFFPLLSVVYVCVPRNFTQKPFSSAECPICLRSLTSQNIGFPEDCASPLHIFCAICIEEWSKNVTTCPIDRKEFTSICIMENWTSRKLVRKIKVERKEYNEQELIVIADDVTHCEVCQREDREHMMLLCDGRLRVINSASSLMIIFCFRLR